jgi:guanyl-specific ribonuclease Sa
MPVLEYVLAHGEPMPDYVGGREYRNLGLDNGQILPRTDAQGRAIRYREWDVNRKVPGRNRGAERLITGSDGRAYYTNDHYATFRRIR